MPGYLVNANDQIENGILKKTDMGVTIIYSQIDRMTII